MAERRLPLKEASFKSLILVPKHPLSIFGVLPVSYIIRKSQLEAIVNPQYRGVFFQKSYFIFRLLPIKISFAQL
jgi:hypothetical protein